VKRPHFHFRSKLWHHHRVRRRQFPVRRGNFGDTTINTGYIAYYLLRRRGYIADVAETCESFTWPSESAAWNLLLSSLLPVTRTCLPAAVVYPLWAFSVPQPSVLDIGSYLLPFPSLFSLIATKVSSDIHFFFCDLTHPVISLATSSRTVLVHFQRSSGVTSSCAASTAVNVLVTSAANCTAFASLSSSRTPSCENRK